MKKFRCFYSYLLLTNFLICFLPFLAQAADSTGVRAIRPTGLTLTCPIVYNGGITQISVPCNSTFLPPPPNKGSISWPCPANQLLVGMISIDQGFYYGYWQYHESTSCDGWGFCTKSWWYTWEIAWSPNPQCYLNCQATQSTITNCIWQ
jgi:hypothetical protein